MRTQLALIIGATLLAHSLNAADIPLGGIGFRYDGSGVHPHAKPPVEFDGVTKKNLRWKTPTANWGYSCPVEVGDQVLVLCEPGGADTTWPVLMSLDRRTGKEQWRTAINPLLAFPLSSDERAGIEKDWASVHEFWRFLHVNAAQFATADEAGRAKINEVLAQRQCFIKGFKQGYGLMRDMENKNTEYHALRKKYSKSYGLTRDTWQDLGITRSVVGVTFATPVTDGERIIVTTIYGTVACLDLQGRILWIQNSGYPQRSGKGTAASPRIAEGKALTCLDGVTVAWDMKTGMKAWEVGKPRGELHGPISSGCVMTVGKTVVYVDHYTRVIRVSDGQLLLDTMGAPKYGSLAYDDERDRFYFSLGKGESAAEWIGVQLRQTGDTVIASDLFRLKPGMGGHSPAFYNGKIYTSGLVLDGTTGLPVRGGDPKFKPTGENVIPRARGTGSAETHHITLIADGRVYGYENVWQPKNDTRPRREMVQVYTVDGKKLHEAYLPTLTKTDPNYIKVWEQGQSDDGKDVGNNYACPFGLGSDAIYLRDDAYIWCFGR